MDFDGHLQIMTGQQWWKRKFEKHIALWTRGNIVIAQLDRKCLSCYVVLKHEVMIEILMKTVCIYTW